MRVVGQTAGGRAALSVILGHGQSPEAAAYDAGWVLERPISAARKPDGDLELLVQVRPRRRNDPPIVHQRGRDRGLTPEAGEPPERRQRIAAYAVVRSRRGLLATQYSAKTAIEGRWGMPGGGLDVGEEPVAAVLREVYEETAQTVVLGALHTVQSAHWLGSNPSGRLEDFHAVRLVYLGECPSPTAPRVLDSDGTTSNARWVPLTEWPGVDWTSGWRQILTELLEPSGPD